MWSNREWMYTMRTTSKGSFNPRFQEYVKYFLDFAFANATNIQREMVEGVETFQIRCPCQKCKNLCFKSRKEIEVHIYSKGFVDDYKVWYVHGESLNTQDVGQCSNPVPSQHLSEDAEEDLGEYTGYDQMIMEGMHENQRPYRHKPQDPNQAADTFYKMLNQANEPLWAGSKTASVLSAATDLLNWKSDCNISDSAFDKLIPVYKKSLPEDEKLCRNFYETKKLLKPLELPSIKIHVCQNHCMLFDGDNSDLDHCLICNKNRYKETGKKVPNMVMTYMPIAPRLQRLFYSKKTAQHMTWHADHVIDQDTTSHPSEAQAWDHVDSVYPDFARETRNIRLGLCTDGFCPNSSSGSPYLSWPVFLTVYNLPPWMALSERYIQLPVIVPGPTNPTHNLDVFLQPLINELKMLFIDGIETYDAHQRNNFQMKVILLWTVSDFPAYGMLSGWSTYGRLACPYCSHESGSFQLRFGGKACWFDCHRKHLPARHPFRKDKINFWKDTTVLGVTPIPEPTGEEIWQIVQHFPTVYQGTPYTKKYIKPPGFGETHNWVKRSIFWELPYWRKLLIRHNLDVMHIEKNFFDNLFKTLMDIKGTKDNVKARQDIELICDRPLLNPIRDKSGNLTKRRADYTLQKEDVKKVCLWLKELKFPDGYASNIGSCVNIKEYNFYPFKSHDSHVFMQRLLPLAIRGFVSKETFEAVTEICMFFRVLCSKRLHIDDVLNMQRTIVTTICKLEKIFPPGFFNSMEHLVIHLPHEALLGGPVQYRWMYQYERKLGMIKRRIRNKSKIGGSIAREHLVNELSTYCSLYFDQEIETRHNREPRNFAPQHPDISSGDSQLSVFVVPSKTLYQKVGKQRLLSIEELKKAHTYVLLNCIEVSPYVIEFDKVAPQLFPNDQEVCLRDKYFVEWFERRVSMGLSDGSTRHLEILARKPSMYAHSHNGYFVNGFKFHTVEHGKGRVTNNYGVCVRGETYNAEEESDYYGLLDEIIELKYYADKRSTVVLFKCTWFHDKRGVVVNKNNLVDVKHKFKLPPDDPFVLASQAEQVFYTPYPAVKGETKGLWAVVKTKARHIYEVTTPDVNTEHGVLQIDERFELPDDVVSSERVRLVTDLTTTEQMIDEVDEEEEEYEDEDTSDDEDEEMVFSDHSSDEDELDK